MSTDKREQGAVDCLIEDGLATVTFFHPSHNSLPGQILAKLANTITELGTKDEVKLILLKSAGDRTFCAGASFDELIAISNLEEGKKFFMGFANVINAMCKCPKLIIGRVQGKAVGGGVGIIAASDVVIASNTAEVKLSEIQIGIAPLVIAPVIIHKIGLAHFSKLSFDPTVFHASHWALDKGLFSAVAKDENELDAIFNQKIQFLSELNPEGLSALKSTIWKETEHFDEEMLNRAAESGKLVLSEQTTLALAPYRKKS